MVPNWLPICAPIKEPPGPPAEPIAAPIRDPKIPPPCEFVPFIFLVSAAEIAVPIPAPIPDNVPAASSPNS